MSFSHTHAHMHPYERQILPLANVFDGERHEWVTGFPRHSVGAALNPLKPCCWSAWTVKHGSFNPQAPDAPLVDHIWKISTDVKCIYPLTRTSKQRWTSRTGRTQLSEPGRADGVCCMKPERCQVRMLQSGRTLDWNTCCFHSPTRWNIDNCV